MNSRPNITFDEAHTLTSIVGLGSNLDSKYGSKLDIMRKAVKALGKLSSQPCIASSVYQSEPEGCPPDSPLFVNSVVVLFLPVNTELKRFFLCIQRLEEKLGRVRSGIGNEPRTIDLDLLFFGNFSFSSDSLNIPHPRALERRFVLEPLAEIAPNLVLPGQKFSVQQLLDDLPQREWVRKLREGQINDAKGEENM